ALQGYQVLPEHDLVIVDEAHDLVDRVTSVATAELGAAAIAAAARRCGRLIDQEVADRLVESADGFTLIVGDLPAGRMDALPSALGTTLAAVRDAAHACITKLGPERKSEVDAATTRKLAL